MTQGLETFVHEIRESLAMAILSVRTNRLRSVLTLLGIAVGVFSIIAVKTAMGVLLNSIESGLSQLGVNTFQVQKEPTFHSNDPKERAKIRNRKDLKFPQGLAVKDRATLAKAVGLEAWTFGKIVVTPDGRKTNPNIQLAGEDIEGITTNNWAIRDGRMYTAEEMNSSKNVAVLGNGVVDKMFKNIDPIGQMIRIDGRGYQVIGIFERQGGLLGGNQDNFIVVPLPTFFDVYGKDRQIHIMVQSISRESYDDCIEQVRGILRAERKVPPGDDDDFSIFSNNSLIEQFNEFTRYVRLGIMLISGVALLAAGVGIMNIMLVSVTERTREIGIRKAIGARRMNILMQFILEAIVLSEFGGIAGILLGVIAGNIIAVLLAIPPVFPVAWAIIGFLICSAIGIIFGVYPAWKASNLDPIESLRYE